LTLFFLVTAGVTAEPDPLKLDEDQVQELGLATDGPALVRFLKQRLKPETDREQIKKLIASLGDEAFQVRLQASQAIIAIGPTALPMLKEALKSPDVEVVKRADDCIKAIEKLSAPGLVSAVMRLLAAKHPDQALPLLLEYLPKAEDPILVDEIARSLARAGVRDGKPDPALVKALTDPSPLLRGVAAEAIGRGAGAANRAEVRTLADKDPDKTVRFRAAVGLIAGRDREGVAALLRLLPDSPADQTWMIEDVLVRVAGEKAPAVTLGDTPQSRKKALDAWQGWWNQHGAALDLAKVEVDGQHRGSLLVCAMGRTGAVGTVLEVDRTGKEVWKIDGLRNPIAVQSLPGDKVLIGEYTLRQVTERNLKGEILWQKPVNNLLVAAQRLANGNTFIATHAQVTEVTRDGKDVMALNRNNDIVAAKKLPNGDIALLTTAGNYIRTDGTGKELQTVAVPNASTVYGTHFEVLPTGRIVVPFYNTNRVAEIDAAGKAIWEATVPQPSAVIRLPNGNFLVTSRLSSQVYELNAAGKEVRKHEVEGRILFATKR
jgi:hypothetical protein